MIGFEIFLLGASTVSVVDCGLLARVVGPVRAPNSSTVQDKSEFARRASAIGLGIHKTSAKLQKLAGLARRTSMFDDPANEIAELSGLIKQDIRRLNTDIAELQAASASRGGTTANNAQVPSQWPISLRTVCKTT